MHNCLYTSTCSLNNRQVYVASYKQSSWWLKLHTVIVLSHEHYCERVCSFSGPICSLLVQLYRVWKHSHYPSTSETSGARHTSQTRWPHKQSSVSMMTSQQNDDARLRALRTECRQTSGTTSESSCHERDDVTWARWHQVSKTTLALLRRHGPDDVTVKMTQQSL